MSDKNVLIQVKDLKKAFGTNQVLDGITTDICQGEVVAVIGPSGSGKSTFLRSLNLLEVPTGGQILFEGTDITDPKTDIDKHRQKMGMVFQHFNLFPHKTIMENITLAPVRLKLMKSEEAKEEALRLLKLVNLEEKADAYIVNTCSVTNMADKKSRQMLHRAKKMNPEAVVIAAGCYVQSAGEELLKDTSVDILIGNNEKVNLPSILENWEKEHNPL